MPIDGGVNRRLMTVEESAGEALQSMKCVKPAMRREPKSPRSLTFLNHSFLRTASSHLSQVLPFLSCSPLLTVFILVLSCPFCSVYCLSSPRQRFPFLLTEHLLSQDEKTTLDRVRIGRQIIHN